MKIQSSNLNFDILISNPSTKNTNSIMATKVGVKYNPPTLGVEFAITASGEQPDAVLIDLSAEIMASSSDRQLLEAAKTKRPDIINSDTVSLPQVLRLLSQLRTQIKGKASSPAAVSTTSSTPIAAPKAPSPTQKNSKASKTTAAAAATTSTSTTILKVGSQVQGKRPNWSKPYNGKITKINHDKVPKTLNIHFEDGSDEKFFPMRYLVNYKQFSLESEPEIEEEDAAAEENTIDPTKIVRVGSRLEVKKPQWSQPYWGEVKKVKSKVLLHMKFDDGTEDKFVKFPWVVNASELIVDDGKTPISSGAGRSKGKKAAYTAPDGKTFTKKSDWAKYMMANFYSFHDQKGKRGTNALIKEPGSVNGQEFHIKDVEDSDVAVLCWSSTVQIDRLRNCKVFVGPVESSCFVRNCENCEFIMACRQLRTRDLKNCTFRLLAGTDPVIERSTELTFAPFNGAYHGLRKHCESARLNPNDNHWRLVFDFNKGGSGGYGITGEHHKLDENKGDDWVFKTPQGDCSALPCENPVPADAVATTESEGGSGFSHGDTAKMKSNKTETVTTTPEVDPASAALAAMPMPTGGPKDPFEFVQAADLPAMVPDTKVRVCFSREGGPIRPSHFYIGKIVRLYEKNENQVFEIIYEDGDKETDVAMKWVQVRKPRGGVYTGDTAEPKASSPVSNVKGGAASPVASTVGDDSGSFELEGSLGDGYSMSFDENGSGDDDAGF